jgi:hypothetical protein
MKQPSAALRKVLAICVTTVAIAAIPNAKADPRVIPVQVAVLQDQVQVLQTQVRRLIDQVNAQNTAISGLTAVVNSQNR